MLSLNITNLSFSFRNRPLFSNLSFAASSGDFVHICGPNGAGKTTLMSILAGLLTPASGKIECSAQNIPVDDLRSLVEYLPAEANGHYPRMDAQSNLRFWTALRGLTVSDAELSAALERWDLSHAYLRFNFPVEKFSTGMKRRLALARVFLSRAQCLLLDEPFYGLDDHAIGIVQAMLSEHLRSGGICIMVSHDTAPIAKLTTQTVTLGTSAQERARTL